MTSLASVLVGCNVVGPSSIQNGRMVYNEAIVTTNNEQTLALIVGDRFAEPVGMLTVASVTANVRVAGSVGAEFGLGPSSAYDGNLVPLSLGVAYEENPTISYLPLQGEKYLREFMAPLPIDLAIILFAAGQEPGAIMSAVLEGINGCRNPAFVDDGDVAAREAFGEITAELDQFGSEGRLGWAQDVDGETRTFAIVLHDLDDSDLERVQRLYVLLGLSPPAAVTGRVQLPVSLGLGRPLTPRMQIQTRSIFELVKIGAAAVEVPDDLVESGLALEAPPLSSDFDVLRIRRSDSRPSTAMTAVKRHGSWYYIDETDRQTKEYFRLLQTLIGARLADTGDTSAAPILTVPVSR